MPLDSWFTLQRFEETDMKYIDADRLKAEIEKPKNELKVGNYYLDNSEQAVGYENALIDFELLIDSLQQEQPSLPSNLDEAAEKYAQKEYPDEPSCGQWGTGDYEPPVDMEYPREIAKDAFKSGAEWMARQMKQEKQEVDLEKEIDKAMKSDLCPEEISDYDFCRIARHFYELGKNSK